MNLTLASLVLSSIASQGCFFTLSGKGSQSQSTFEITSSHFNKFTPVFLKINSLPLEQNSLIPSNHRFVFNNSSFSNFLSSAVIVSEIPIQAANCLRLQTFRQNRTNILDQTGLCSFIRKVVFTNFTANPAVLYLNSSNYAMYMETTNFTACTLCMYIINGSIDIESVRAQNCTATSDTPVNTTSSILFSSADDYSIPDKEPYHIASFLILENSRNNNLTSVFASDCIPSAILLNYSTAVFSKLSVITQHRKVDDGTAQIYLSNCAMVEFTNSMFSDESEGSLGNQAAIYATNCQNIILFFSYFRQFPDGSFILKDNSFATMNYACFPIQENQSILHDDTSTAIILSDKHVVFTKDCHFTPLPTTALTTEMKNYGIITLVVFTVFFFCVFVAFVACAFCAKREKEPVYNALNPEDIPTDSTSRSISD